MWFIFLLFQAVLLFLLFVRHVTDPLSVT